MFFLIRLFLFLSTVSLFGAQINIPLGWQYKAGKVIEFYDMLSPVVDITVGINHASTVALIIKDRMNNYHYICQYNFIAKAYTTDQNITNVGIPCKHSILGKSSPLFHSEVSALQYIYGVDNPVYSNSILNILLHNHDTLSFVLMIRNSGFPPCSTIPKTAICCRDYLFFRFKSLFDKSYISIRVQADGAKVLHKIDFNSDEINIL